MVKRNWTVIEKQCHKRCRDTYNNRGDLALFSFQLAFGGGGNFQTEHLLSRYSIHYWKWVLKSLTSLFSTHIFTVVITSWWIHPFSNMYYLFFFLSLVPIFYLKSILSDISIAIPSLFWFLFAWNVFLNPLAFNYLCFWMLNESPVDKI